MRLTANEVRSQILRRFKSSRLRQKMAPPIWVGPFLLRRVVRIWEEFARIERTTVPLVLSIEYLTRVSKRRLLSFPPNQLTQGLIWHYGVRKEIQMESLALLVSIMLLAVYTSGVTAFVASWLRSTKAKIVTNLFGAISIISGVLLWFSLRDGNGFFVGIIPISLGVFAILNYRRRNS